MYCVNGMMGQKNSSTAEKKIKTVVTLPICGTPW